jgi:AsmA protein
VHANIAGGQAAIDTLGLRTGRLSVDGHGRLGLADGALDLRLLPDARVGSAWISLPMHVTGSLRDPHPALDPAASGGRYALSIGPGGDPGSDCTGPLRAAREGLAGPAVGAVPPAESGGKRKTPKPVDILRGLGILH